MSLSWGHLCPASSVCLSRCPLHEYVQDPLEPTRCSTLHTPFSPTCSAQRPDLALAGSAVFLGLACTRSCASAARSMGLQQSFLLQQELSP